MGKVDIWKTTSQKHTFLFVWIFNVPGQYPIFSRLPSAYSDLEQKKQILENDPELC